MTKDKKKKNAAFFPRKFRFRFFSDHRFFRFTRSFLCFFLSHTGTHLLYNTKKKKLSASPI